MSDLNNNTKIRIYRHLKYALFGCVDDDSNNDDFSKIHEYLRNKLLDCGLKDGILIQEHDENGFGNLQGKKAVDIRKIIRNIDVPKLNKTLNSVNLITGKYSNRYKIFLPETNTLTISFVNIAPYPIEEHFIYPWMFFLSGLVPPTNKRGDTDDNSENTLKLNFPIIPPKFNLMCFFDKGFDEYGIDPTNFENNRLVYEFYNIRPTSFPAAQITANYVSGIYRDVQFVFDYMTIYNSNSDGFKKPKRKIQAQNFKI